jgi:hypothetical protein
MMVDCACPPRCHTRPAPSVSSHIVETLDLLARFQSLSSDELLTLAMNLDSIANHLDAMADRNERDDSGREYV